MAAGGEKRRGERNGASKLTPEKVLEIRRRYVSGVGCNNYKRRGNSRELAAEFGVGKTAIRDIVAGVTWGWLEDDGYSEIGGGLRDFG